MCFPETAYEPQYAAMYGKQASTPDEYGQVGPYQETQADCLTIDGSMSGLAYTVRLTVSMLQSSQITELV